MAPRTASRRTLARTLTWVVALLHTTVVVTFLLDPGDPPRAGGVWQALWALSHKPSFVPLLGLLVVAPPATWLAWTTRGGHRHGLLASWAAFGAVVTIYFAHRVWVMTRLVWEHGV